jgi:diguanylate cyclase (GGDEF)-like protein
MKVSLTPTKITVLLIEDSPVDEERVRRLLGRSDYEFEIWSAYNWRGSAEVLARKRVDLILSDYDLPGDNGLAILNRLNGLAISPPVIFLTGSGNEDVAAEAFREGAVDYLRKDRLTTEVLITAILRVLDKRAATEQEKARNELLEALASTDPLTGLYNRRFLEEAANAEISQARSHNRAVSCLMIDIDNLKDCNETLGHQAGDALIQLVARAIRLACRESDIVVRYGGDEFCVILPEADYEVAVATATRILEEVRWQRLPQGMAFSAAVSIGAYTAMQPNALTTDGIIARADELLRRAKDLGKNMLVNNSPPLTAAPESSSSLMKGRLASAGLGE